ncbi:MAG TPA: hypothetical protein PLQ89_02060 [Phycisphaerae bacterium]|nr:hypothetical protein [Phycisphaerae bacterium]HOM51101.1 hypothetical protein [Phycisphaerae bacterium]HON68944.1 hypothetical protein [Phycisphaerae bacterium]HOQ84477.1 hypothetical protein [Phycisphaerae bacterium]HPP28517.1 hypothetical protein [Phycisphaerae bacterium]
MGKTHRRLDLDAYPIPPDIDLLGPEWMASFSIYWRVQRPDQARTILDLVVAAMREAVPERSVWLLQKALRQLGLIEVSLLRLILTRYLVFVRDNSPEPAQRIAGEVLATLVAVEKARARGGRPRKEY